MWLAAAECLGVTDIELWELQDYPMEITAEVSRRILKTIREFRPDLILMKSMRSSFMTLPPSLSASPPYLNMPRIIRF